MGTQSTTEHGYTCQSWASDTPHNPFPSAQDDSNYPDGSREAASNYCRNPDRDPGGLWCYTTLLSVTWDYCVIPLCRGMVHHVYRVVLKRIKSNIFWFSTR